jgi:outer membrane protein, heavy metal efflux system
LAGAGLVQEGLGHSGSWRALTPMIRLKPCSFVQVMIILTLAGCAAVDPRPDYERLAQQVQSATGQALDYRPDDRAEVAQRVQQLLRDGLTADDAAQVCLLNNRQLQAEFGRIGAARADVVQAGLLSNPMLSLGVKFPDAGGLAKLEAAFVQNLADIWQIPARKRVAERTLDRTILQVARDAGLAMFEAKTRYYRAAQASRKREIQVESVQIAQQILDLALARQQAGAGSEVDVNLARSEVQDAELGRRAATLEAFEAGSALATQLSLATPPDQIKLVDDLPELPELALEDNMLLRMAVTYRLDIGVAKAATEESWARIQQEQAKVFPTFELGLGVERDERRAPDGRDILADSVQASVAEGSPRVELAPQEQQHTDSVVGPTLGVELPIFNQNQGGIARARYAHEQDLRLLEELWIQVGQEVRLASARGRSAWSNVRFYREQVLPIREASLELARTAYQAGRTPLLNVLEAQRALLNARAGYAEALQAAASTVVELEAATGQPFARIREAIAAADQSGIDGSERDALPAGATDGRRD